MRHLWPIPSRLAVLCAAIGVLCGCAPREAAEATQPRPALRAMVFVGGSSMLPTYAESEVVTLELCRFDELRAGDTIIYWHEGTRGYIHHRLFQRDAVTNRWKAKGDNNVGLDTGLVTPSVFVGRTHKL